MKTLGLAAFLCALLLCTSCRQSDNANPLAPSATPVLPVAGPVSFQTSIGYMIGGQRVSFNPSADVTISRVMIAPPGGISIDTVLSSEPTRVFSKGIWYALDGYIAGWWGLAGDSWKFTFSGKVEPADTQYTCTSEWIIL